MYYRTFSSENYYKSLPNQHVLHVIRTMDDDNGKKIIEEKAFDINQRGKKTIIPFDEAIRLLEKSPKKRLTE